ncbi:MAG: UpxY family transcription antiterminator [Haliscomenobacteraceae bacterium CHB4]|nr:Transcription antitermination protein RfaH [Saprospiraceae bacterium]MCE7923546.1 UpxY family transcription antiterminator [Haliscomenobacteraceae bacterium CHB4]
MPSTVFTRRKNEGGQPSTVHRQPSTVPVINHLHDTEPRWFAVHTRSKSEKFVQRMLEKKGIHAWLPLQKLMRRYTRSTRLTEKPLINCYIFVKIAKEKYVPVLETENVAGFVKFGKNLVSIPESEIEMLKRITLEDGLDVEAVKGSFTEGDPVEIAAGNLAGLKGRIVKVEGKRKFQVELDYLFHSLLITVDAAFLEKTKLKVD